MPQRPDPARPAARRRASCRRDRRPRCGRVAAQCRGENFAARSQCGYRRIGAADTGAADDQEQIARVAIERCRNRFGIAAAGGEGDGFGTGSLRTLRDQIRRHVAAGDIDDAQPRTADVQSLQSRRARQQQIARQHAPPGLRDETASGDIAAGPAHALPRDRLRQHLRHRPGNIDGIGIEHAIASHPASPRRPRPRSAAPSTAAANRRMRRRDRARERHSRRPRQCRAADRPAAAASRRRCSAALPQASVRPARPVPRPAAGRRAPDRAASARSAGAAARSWLAYALNRTGNKQNPVRLVGRPLLRTTLTPRQNSCN